jgi:hypothetical protein
MIAIPSACGGRRSKNIFENEMIALVGSSMAPDGFSFSNIFFERCRRQDGNGSFLFRQYPCSSV